MARILVVDDEEGVRSFLADALRRDAHEVTEAANGQVAAGLLDAHTYDLLVTDLRMPGLDGLELVRKVRAEQPETEVVVLTAHGSVETAVEAMKLGAFDFVQKPLSGPHEIRLTATRATEHRALLALKDRATREAETAAAAAPSLSYGDPAMRPVVEALERVARTSATVLLTGESGTGKEVAARAVHRLSPRSAGPFVAVNCAALPEHLLESEMYGHEKGAFTGATERRRGRVELAHGGTLFLDELGELEPKLQAKLLRVLEERRFERVGGSRTLEADVRWIAATNRDLRAQVRDGRFREDLYHRLAVFPIELPPLRARRADVVPLAEALLARIVREMKRGPLALDETAKERLVADDWPGNVRALRNALERAAILADGAVVKVEHLRLDTWRGGAAAAVQAGGGGDGDAAEPVTLDEIEQRAIARALVACHGNRRQAAERLGIGLRTLYDKLKRYGMG